MGVWDEYCVLCAGPIRNHLQKGWPANFETGELLKKTRNEYNWLEKLYIVTNSEKVLKINGTSYDNSGAFIIKKDSKYPPNPNNLCIITPDLWHEYLSGNKYGIVCHQDCYHLIETKLHHKIQFANICRLLAELNCVLKSKSKYGLIKKYSFRQDFDWFNADKENSWLLQSPLKNKDNATRILSTWKSLVDKFKKNPPRPSPAESATRFKSNTVLIGYDKKLWIVKSPNGINKWFHYDPKSDIKFVGFILKPIKKSRKSKK